MTDDHDIALRDFDRMLGACTVRAVCGRDYVLPSKFKEWLQKSRAGPYNWNQFARLHDAAYRDWSQPAHLMSSERICEDNCLFLFSILLEMRRGELIHELWRLEKSDRDLPIDLYALLVLFEDLGIEEYKAVAEDFDRRQWKYCAATLEFNTPRNYPTSRIMPFRRRAKINEKGGTAQLWQVEVLEDFVGPKLRKQVQESLFDPKDGFGPRYEFALKTFEDGNKGVFHNERDAFLALLTNKAMVKYLGYYSHKELQYDNDDEEEDGGVRGSSSSNPRIVVPEEQRGVLRATHNILLEYAESDLEEYFVDNQPPAFQPELEAFWSGLVEVSDAVKGIHNLETNNGGRVRQFYGWHADIKPDNILIVHGKFKLADPGFVKWVKKTETKPKEVQNGGTETFGAPERHDGWEENPSEVDQSIDMWSLACVFSIAATWVVVGYQGIRQFEKLREKAISSIMKQEATLPKDKKSRPSLSKGCSFHDSIQVLVAVTEWHKFLRDALRGTDTITRAILDLVDNRMLLQDPKKRIEADELCKELNRIIHDGKAKQRIPVPMSIQSLLQEVEEEAPQPSKSQPALSVHSVSVSSRLTPATIAGARKSKFLGPLLQKTAHRSQVLRSILAPEIVSTTIIDRSYPWKTDESGPAHTSERQHTEPDEPAPRSSDRTSRDTRTSRDVLHHSISESSAAAKHSRPKTPKRSTTIPYQTVFQARQEGMEGLASKKKKDPLLSKYFDKRDLKFLVDNPGTMSDFWQEATELLMELVRKARGQDENGMDLFFTSGSVRVDGKEARGKLMALMKDDPFQAAMKHPDARPTPGHRTDITKALGDVFWEYIQDAKRRGPKNIRNLTLIVFTDGRWDALPDKEDVKRLVVKFVSNLNGIIGDFRKRPVSIEFVQFDDDPDASHRLRALDNELVFEGIADIIDTEHSSGNINKMLLGSFNPEIDEDEDKDDDSNQAVAASPTQIQDGLRTLEPTTSPTRASSYMISTQGSRASTVGATPRSSRLDPKPENSIFGTRRSGSRKRDSRKT